MSAAPNKYIEHITEIDAPIEEVWSAIIDIKDWSWNKWTRLEADAEPAKGVKGKLLASFDGNDEWKTFDFEFGEIDPESRVFTWLGNVGPGGCLFHGYHTMRLEVIDKEEVTASTCTRLIHTETFRGVLPLFRMGLPFKKIDRNYLLMNENLKEFIEGIDS
mmetsp:Transcript_2726/g.4049  ORF Transcript_2726/g.4049 Transcript_2726/m.4049 type:complete len:161 (+) Transcript_2726:66-548(+)|eukprot:CAMPEP_0194214180 /NCGR_PEP_ID=MMETSP0156-20130528/15320_1 /TAXON_ID=33649 /ORGANISM="Thalassionema nitzschioides, Strain L26-B" /LENGTH=160 /DNA_ID=CAMNT_0038942399 /DNA_START=20 /DNA_END=502 /DNA_ORIENTATION=+